MLAQSIPSKPRSRLCGLRFLLLIPYGIIWFCLSLLSAAEWLVQNVRLQSDLDQSQNAEA